MAEQVLRVLTLAGSYSAGTKQRVPANGSTPCTKNDHAPAASFWVLGLPFIFQAALLYSDESLNFEIASGRAQGIALRICKCANRLWVTSSTQSKALRGTHPFRRLLHDWRGLRLVELSNLRTP